MMEVNCGGGLSMGRWARTSLGMYTSINKSYVEYTNETPQYLSLYMSRYTNIGSSISVTFVDVICIQSSIFDHVMWMLSLSLSSYSAFSPA